MKNSKAILKKGHLARIITLGLLLATVLVYFFVPPINSALNEIFALMTSLNIEEAVPNVVEYIRSFGGWAVAMSFFLMLLANIFPPIPTFLVTLSNAVVFGWWQGAIISWVSAMVGASLCFIIARFLGRDVVAKFASKGILKQVDTFFDRHGRNAVLICRLLPFMPFAIVSYAAGLTKIKFAGFILATGLGQTPATVIYSYVGGMLTGGVQWLFLGLISLFTLSTLAIIIKSIYDRKHKGKNVDKIEEESV